MTPEIRAAMDAGKCTTTTEYAGGRRAVTGGEDLKETQAYTPQYASAVVDAWENWRSATINEIPDSDSASDYDAESDTWSDVGWEDIMTTLDKP